MSNYQEFLERFKKLTNEELIITYNKNRSKPGWVSARGEFLAALRHEFESRGIDYPPSP